MSQAVYSLSPYTTVFNARILNSTVYQAVTGEASPTRRNPTKTYASHCFPFYHMYKGPSGIHGDLGMIESITQLDRIQEAVVEPKVALICPDSLINPNGPLRALHTVYDLEEEFNGFHSANF
jgi:hypothetical protein